MGNCPSPFLPEENWDEEIERCDSGSCTKIQQVITKNNFKRGNVKLNDTQEWKDGIIPYELHSSLNFNKHRILKAMKTIEEYSRMRFVERSYEDTYLMLNKGEGCFFQRGDGFQQPRVSLGIGCEDFGTVLHELMHAIGFPHEQKRPDRDDYITIHWENIKRGSEPQFRKLKRHEYEWSEFPFDFNSIMMYDDKAFSKNGFKTMEAKNGKTMPRKTNLSEIDKRKLLSL
ncbi:hypothetical protein JTE90_026297 [Oedothorax gibbosus]|uniref:Metalloendopeptidase n=1 Tax=Oedothorax gibbosus TaxID=931172 RepID=A0AAV6U402_9ARAC|nr:hypothetical protein JTE90_026297 [Oedothorax gibbosus]